MDSPELIAYEEGVEVPSHFLNEVVQLDHRVFGDEGLLESLSKLQSIGKTRQQYVIIAKRPDDEQRDSLCGYIVYQKKSIAGHIQTLVVAPNCRRQGIGRSLMQWAIAQLSQARVMSITLHVDVKQTAAINLYQSLGFIIDSTKKDYYPDGRDAYFMEMNVCS